MVNGKIRHKNHIIDAKAILFLQNFFPAQWVTRPIHPDYGLDLDLELFDEETETSLTLGEHIFLQVKGTESPVYSKTRLFGTENEASSFKNQEKEIGVINHSLEVSTLNLVEKIGSCMPVLLVIVDLKNNQAYFVCLNDYICHVLPYQQPNYKSQKHVTIHIPTDNKLSLDAIRWYGKRIKICSLLQEILAVKDDCKFLKGIELVEKVHALITRIQNNDAWNARNHWRLMQILYEKVQELINNGMYDHEGAEFVKQCANNSEDWKNVTLYVGMDEHKEDGLTFAKEHSCSRFLDLSGAMLSSFENNVRNFWLPTYFWYM